MVCFANLDPYTAINQIDYRNMLFFGRVDGIFGHSLHGIAAAHQFAVAPVNHLYNVSACITFVNFESFCQNRLLSAFVLSISG
jgi:hypothetical protein